MNERDMNEREIAMRLQAAQHAQARSAFDEAIAHYEAILAARPEHAGALNSLGVIALNAGEAERAIGFHRRAAQADPQAAVLWLNLAKAQRMAGDDEGERAALDAALAIDAVYFPALVRKAQLHERLGEDAQAIYFWQGVIQIAPGSGGGLDDLLGHAHSYVRRRSQHLASTIDAGLADARAAASASLRRFDACIDVVTGRRRVFVNECAGMHYPFLPADEFFERSHFPWLDALEAQTDAIRNELEALLGSGAPGFAPYVQMAPGTPENKWTPLNASTAWNAYHLWHYGKPLADAQARCPATVAALSAVPQLHLPGRCPNVFFSLLEPGARIPPHTGVTNVRTIVHLPLIVPDNCGFRVGGETREWAAGQAFAFDDTIEHEAWNDSNELRAVLILDVWNPHITEEERALLLRYFDVADEAGLSPAALEGF